MTKLCSSLQSLNHAKQPDETELLQMTLPVFLLSVYGKQRKREEGGDKILEMEMEVLRDIGIQRFVAHLAFQARAACFMQ